MKTKTRVKGTRTRPVANRRRMDWRARHVRRGACGYLQPAHIGHVRFIDDDGRRLDTPPATVGGVAVTVPFCRVQGTARPTSDSEIKFEVWLPPTLAAWTGRMKVNGTGGYSGATPYARLNQDVGDGFVSAGSNMGHDGGEAASWTLGHPEKVKDWGLRAHYYVATAAKTLADAFYGKPVSYSYFEGCSNGGRQALMMAQNYPALFDGIAAGAPSNFYPDVLMWLTWTGKTLTPVLGQPDGACRNDRLHGRCDDGLGDRAATAAVPTSSATDAGCTWTRRSSTARSAGSSAGRTGRCSSDDSRRSYARSSRSPPGVGGTVRPLHAADAARIRDLVLRLRRRGLSRPATNWEDFHQAFRYVEYLVAAAIAGGAVLARLALLGSGVAKRVAEESSAG